MVKFLRRLAALLLPMALVVALMLGLLAQSGEFCSVSEVAARMAAGEPLRFELNYRSHSAAQLKSEVAALRGADVLVLGTSRTMQFCSAMLPKADFYNAGGAVSTLGQVLPFLQNLPAGKRPHTLILGLDQYFFNAAWDNSSASDAGYTAPVDPIDVPAALFGFLHHCGEGKIDLIRLAGAGSGVFGVPARVRGSGFISDGSYLYGTQAEDRSVDLTFADARARIAGGTNRFQYGEEVSDGSLAILRELLEWCSQQGIRVVAYLPPYAPSVCALMQQSGSYGYLDLIYPKILEIFDIFDMECYDFTWMKDSADEEFIDGFHAGDQVYVRMLLAMLEQGSSLAAYTDAAHLNALLGSAYNARVLRYGAAPG